ncbi:MAG: NHL repeat-containing protein, partial [Acidobacteriota bacterium]
MTPMTPSALSRFLAASLLLTTAVITGCGTGLTTAATSTTTLTSAPKVTGRAMGGQQPLAFSTIQLYAVNTTTLRGASAPQLTQTVTTDAQGYFTLTGLYHCPTGALVYLTATQGTVGTATNNSAIALMSGLGACSALNAGTIITMNELTTVASAYALAPFAADYSHIGAPASGLTGITNAFATINTLVNTSTGQSPGLGLPAGTSVPFTELNTLADIVADCVNTDAAALPTSGSPTPTDTISALLNIASNPSANVATLFSLQVAQAPFVPKLSSTPQDWSVALKLTGSALSAPYGVAIDASGNAWITNETGNSLTEFDPTGKPISGVSGIGSPNFRGAQGITIDPGGNIIVANTGGNSVIKLKSDGTFFSPTAGYTLASFNAPVDVAADARKNIWVANFLGNSVTEIDLNGVIIGSPLTAGATLSRPSAIAIDPNGGVWISNSGVGTLTKYDKNATLISTGNGFTDNALQAPAGLAADSLGELWVAGQGGNEISA